MKKKEKVEQESDRELILNLLYRLEDKLDLVNKNQQDSCLRITINECKHDENKKAIDGVNNVLKSHLDEHTFIQHSFYAAVIVSTVGAVIAFFNKIRTFL